MEFEYLSSPPSVLEKDHASVTMVWSKGKGSDYTYEVQMQESLSPGEHDGEWRTLSAALKNNVMKKKNLVVGTAYRFRVRHRESAGLDEEGWYPWSTASEYIYVLHPDFHIMKAPLFQDHDGNSITVHWEEIPSAEGYLLRYRKEEQNHWTNIETIINGTFAKKKGLENGHYFFSVMPSGDSIGNWGYSASAGPFKVADLHPYFHHSFPSMLLSKNAGTTSIVPTSSKLCGKVVAVYFSAHWCGPCRNFTPKLVELYNHSRQHHKNFEVVFCSADHGEDEFKSYYSEMPWLAIDFNDERREQLMGQFKVSGIPRLVILAPNGHVIVDNAAGAPLTPQSVDNWIQLAAKVK